MEAGIRELEGNLKKVDAMLNDVRLLCAQLSALKAAQWWKTAQARNDWWVGDPRLTLLCF